MTFNLQVIAPEEIVDPDVDEHSVMTYLSQFPKAKLKPGAPIKPKQLHPKKAKAYGPGGSRPKALIFTEGRIQRRNVSVYSGEVLGVELHGCFIYIET